MRDKLEQVKKQWLEYIKEFEATDEIDIEKHITMALKVGYLLSNIEIKDKAIQSLEKQVEMYCDI